jgi:SAM-dependent methyltransferase
MRDCQQYARQDGIWRFLPPALAGEYQSFIETYEKVRRAEGWEHADDAYYRSLPYTYGRQRFQEVWRIRVGSYQSLMTRIVKPLAARAGRPLHVLDLGAGTGWLSYRLALAGHASAAVDLLTNDWDGLGAWKRFADVPLYVPVQAAFDQLPFADGVADLAIFNGAIHYARDYARTLREALRLLRPWGQLVIMDSPFYGRGHSGAQMVREKEASFAQDYGVDITTLPAENFVTPGRLEELGRQLGITWRLVRPFRGWRWTIHWWRHRLRGGREPARFPLIIGQPGAS